MMSQDSSFSSMTSILLDNDEGDFELPDAEGVVVSRSKPRGRGQRGGQRGELGSQAGPQWRPPVPGGAWGPRQPAEQGDHPRSPQN